VKKNIGNIIVKLGRNQTGRNSRNNENANVLDVQQSSKLMHDN
jgi:hypothetical protein